MGRKKPRIISLFSGAMGLDIGLEAAGFKTSVVVETNKAALATIKTNFNNLPRISDPIQNVTTQKILKKGNLTPGDVALVAGGPCCQSFSTAGKRGSVCDPRGLLFVDYCRVVREAKPRFFIMENVKGLLSAAITHRPLNERGPGHPPLKPEEELGSAFKRILNELQALNYYIVFGLVNSADYGTPQKRHRVILIGSRDGEDISIPSPSHSKAGDNGSVKWLSLGEALKGLQSTEWVEFTDKKLKYLKNLKPGQNWKALPKKLQKEALGGAYVSWGGRSGFCRRLSWDEPSPSLTTAPDGKATTLCHPTKNRPLSVEEYVRIQEFPPTHIFVGSIREKYTMIGNAVPIGIGKAIGKMLIKTMRTTDKSGLPLDASDRKGRVVCNDPLLEKRLKSRPKTQLPPPTHRSNPDPAAAREWLAKTSR